MRVLGRSRKILILNPAALGTAVRERAEVIACPIITSAWPLHAGRGKERQRLEGSLSTAHPLWRLSQIGAGAVTRLVTAAGAEIVQSASALLTVAFAPLRFRG